MNTHGFFGREEFWLSKNWLNLWNKWWSKNYKLCWIEVSATGLLTLMCEVGAIINGRSIIKVSDYPSDYEALTPNHLLVYQSENGKP